MQLVEPDNLERWNAMNSRDRNTEWDSVLRAEWDRKTVEQQLNFATIKAAELNRQPQVKLGLNASAMERKAMQRARERGIDYEPATERGEGAHEALQQLSFAEDARERFDAACAAYSEARELGFSRTRSAYEAAREALLFGVEPPVQPRDFQRDISPSEQPHLRGLARMKARQRSREQARETVEVPERASLRKASVWDALDTIGRTQGGQPEQSVISNAMARVQERTEEHRQERETEEAERQRLESEKQEREQDRDIGLGYGF